jgi:hypothetical protein
MLLTSTIFIPSAILTSYETDGIRVLFGIRWFYPFTLAVALCLLAPQQSFTRNGMRLVIAAMAINLAAQIFQTFVSPPPFFVGDDGLLSRAPGLFFLPSASSIIMCISYLYVSTAIKSSRNKKPLYFALTLLISSIYLSDSATALMILLVIVGYELKILRNSIFGLIGSIAFIAVGLFLATLVSPRGNQLIERSAGNRVLLLVENFSKFNLVSQDFGSYTSAGVMLGTSGYSSLESTIGSIFGNLGILSGSLCLIVFFGMMIRSAISNKDSNLVVPAITVVLGAFFAVNAFEFFPIGALMFILVKNMK